MKNGIVVIVGLTLGILTGCAGPKVAMNPGAIRLVERIPNQRPDWADWGQSFKEDKDKFLFVGAVRDRGDYALSVREASIEATKIAAEQLVRELNTSLRSSVVGQNVGDDLGRSIQDLFVQESRALSIMGLVQRERYAEKWAVGTVAGQNYAYNAYALLEIPKADFLTSKQALLDRAAGRAREGRNTQAEKLLEEFRQEIKGGRQAVRQ